MWLSVADYAKRDGVSVRTIQRRIRSKYYPPELIQETASNGRGGITYKIFWSTYDTSAKTTQKTTKELTTLTTDLRQPKTTYDKMSQVKNETYDINKPTYDNDGLTTNYDTKTEDLCNQCKSSHPECNGCCNICEDKCNNEQECRLNLTGQEKKPELNHKGADSSPVPTPDGFPSGKPSLTLTTEIQIQTQTDDNLFLTSYRTRPEPEVPDSYKRVGQLRSQLCDYMLTLVSENGISKTEAYERTVSLYNFGSIVIELRNHKPNHNITTRTLQKWVSDYKKADHDYFELVPGYTVGSGSITITQVEEDYLLRYYLNQNKPLIGSIITNLKTEVMHGDIISPSSITTLRRWMNRYIKSNKRLAALAREGETHIRNNFIKYIERDSAVLIPGDVFIADGNTLNFRIIDPETGKPKRMVFLPVMDWASRAIVGASIAATEDTQNITNAYRNAMINFKGVPRVMYLDNGRAFKSIFFRGKKGSDLPDLENLLGGLFKRLGIQEFFAKAYNARAKIIERWFKSFNDGFERFLDSYTGASISDKPAHMNRNEPFMKKLVDDKPLTYPEAQALISLYINRYYHKQPHKGLKGKTPEEVLLAHPCPAKRIISPSELDFLMLKHDLKQVNRNGITFLKQSYWHPKLADLIKEKMYFRYDPNNISFIQVYNEHGKFICTAKPNEKTHPMAILSDNQEVSEKQIKKEIRYQNRIVKETKDNLLQTLSNTQNTDQKFIDLTAEDATLFNTPQPALPEQSKTMDEMMLEQSSEPVKSKKKKSIKLDTDIKTLGLG